MAGRHALADAQWTRIENLLPGKAGDPGRTAADDRSCVDAVLDVLKTGLPWADLPERFGKPNTVWKRFDRWCGRNVWEGLFQALGEADLTEELAELQRDSRSVKAPRRPRPGAGGPGKKRPPTCAAPSAAAGGADHEASRRLRPQRAADPPAADGRPSRRRPAGRGVAGRLPPRSDRLRDRRRRLRLERDP